MTTDTPDDTALIDGHQRVSMNEIDKAFGKAVQSLALLHLAHKRSIALTPADSEVLLKAANGALDTIAAMLDGIDTRITFASQDGHAQVTAWASHMADQFGKLALVTARMQQSFS